MKNIIIMLLLAFVPFLTIAQGKKSKSNVEYMMIKGVEVQMKNVEASGADVREMALGNITSENIKLFIAFDYGNLRTAEVKAMQGQRFRTMMSAVNTAAEKGWEFVNANVVLEDKMKIHYYYMKRNKKK
jgi:hypothetical protein